MPRSDESSEKFSGSNEQVVASTEPRPFLIMTEQLRPLTRSSIAFIMLSNWVTDLRTSWKVSKPYARRSERVADSLV